MFYIYVAFGLIEERGLINLWIFIALIELVLCSYFACCLFCFVTFMFAVDCLVLLVVTVDFVCDFDCCIVWCGLFCVGAFIVVRTELCLYLGFYIGCYS